MDKSVERYSEALRKLLPSGRTWESKFKGNLSSLLEGMAEELCRVREKILDLYVEIDPTRTNQLLEDWEKMLGLPDDCTPSDVTLTIDERRAHLVSKLTHSGGASKADFKKVSTALGYQIEIEEFKRFRVGSNMCGDQIWGATFWNKWRVVTEPSESQIFRVGKSRAGEPLRSFNNEILTCTFEKLKPAHTEVLFKFIV